MRADPDDGRGLKAAEEMPPKSIFRQPGATHFQLVHRSQRDPLVHDPEASQHVLKPILRENAKKGKSRAELEALISVTEFNEAESSKSGEAALYGIYYDDTEYDYMQHLRPVGVQEDGVESILIEAPSHSHKQQKGDKQKKGRIDLPSEVLPSVTELKRTYESQQAIPESIAGFQPDMDPHLRQVLEALEDDAFVDDSLEDDFFGELVQDGERGSDEEVEFEFYEDGDDPDGKVNDFNEEATWEEQFSRFKKLKINHDSDYEDNATEAADTVASLPSTVVIGGKGKRRRKGASDASGYSMSSASMYRTDALQTLDERFDELMSHEYEDEYEEQEDDGIDNVPDLIESRSDFSSMMDEFLDDHEILGRKLKPKMPGESGAEKLGIFRKAFGEVDHEKALQENSEDEMDDIFVDEEDKDDRWDCETILTTFSNLENHPRLIRIREMKSIKKIHLDPKTGLPFTQAAPVPKPARKMMQPVRLNTGNETSEDESPKLPGTTIKRPKSETAEEKRARKAAMKQERAVRRADKKATRDQFGSEYRTQSKQRLANDVNKGTRRLE